MLLIPVSLRALLLKATVVASSDVELGGIADAWDASWVVNTLGAAVPAIGRGT